MLFPVLKGLYGCGSKLSHQGTAGFGLWFHLPGSVLGPFSFLTHSPITTGHVFILSRGLNQMAVAQKTGTKMEPW